MIYFHPGFYLQNPKLLTTSILICNITEGKKRTKNKKGEKKVIENISNKQQEEFQKSERQKKREWFHKNTTGYEIKGVGSNLDIFHVYVFQEKTFIKEVLDYFIDIRGVDIVIWRNGYGGLCVTIDKRHNIDLGFLQNYFEDSDFYSGKPIKPKYSDMLNTSITFSATSPVEIEEILEALNEELSNIKETY